MQQPAYDLSYTATKVASSFHHSDALVRLLMGPVGCGKSVASILELFHRAVSQEPGHDGIRRSKWAVVRNTYPELKSTTIQTWQTWFKPEIFGPIKYDTPIVHRLCFDDVDSQIIFLSLDNPHTDIGKLMSLELTGAYINELQFIPKPIFDILLQRINRYPSAITGAKITWAGIIADTNPPDSEHWIYKMFESNKPQNYEIFKYAPAVIKCNADETLSHYRSLQNSYYKSNAAADYIWCQNDQNYWINLVSGYSDEQIKVFLCGEYGVFVDGRAVHAEYADHLHYSADIKSLPNVEVGLGWDFGLTPACSVVQLSPHGQLLSIKELYSDDMSLRDFAEYVVIPWLNLNMPWWLSNYVSRHDPAGQAGAQTDGKNCQDILRDLGIQSEPAASNNSPTARRDGLKYFLRRLIGGEPGYLLGKDCQRLRKGLMGSYQYPRLKGSVEDKYQEKPLKNIYSHICEAHEYIAMHYSRNVSRPANVVDFHKELASEAIGKSNLKRGLSWHLSR
jgi:hypothetical protein